MKKIALITAAVASLGLAACGGNEAATTKRTPPRPTWKRRRRSRCGRQRRCGDAMNAADNALDAAGNSVENASEAVANALKPSKPTRRTPSKRLFKTN
jgi:hypothetical protein